MNPTDFSELIGNEEIKRYLERMIERKTVANSLLFAGPAGIGKSLFAKAFAAKLICQKDPQGTHRHKVRNGTHPDIRHFRPEGKLCLHSMESMRQLTQEVYLPPYEAEWKVFIIHEADRMLTYSANALLKTFEEPPPQTIIILISSAPTSLLPTVRSRCRALHFKPLAFDEMESVLKKQPDIDTISIPKILALSNGSLRSALDMIEKKGNPSRDILFQFFCKGRVDTYKELTALVQTLNEQMDVCKKEAEEGIKEEQSKIVSEHLSAQQQHLMEKELDGVVSMRYQQEANAIFGYILSWYRDLNFSLIQNLSNELINADFKEQLMQIANRGNILPLEKVQKALDEARLGIERSTAFSICMENLLLKLNVI